MKRYIDFANENNLTFIDSYTNFIVLYLENSTKLANELLKRGIIIRDMASYGFDAVRITIGKSEENDKVLSNLRDLIEI